MVVAASLGELPANLGNGKPKNKPRSYPFKNARSTRFQNKGGKTFFSEVEMNAALWEIALMEFGASVCVEDDYSVRQSLRRGSTTQAQNQGIPEIVVEANQRWRKHERLYRESCQAWA
jgi:hypothetical protein